MPRPAQPDCKPSDIFGILRTFLMYLLVFAGADSVILSRHVTTHEQGASSKAFLLLVHHEA